MINGIVKLFYSEVVKSKMKSMPNEDYYLSEEYKGISNVAMKIDNVFGILFKVLFTIILIGITLNINIIFGIGMTLIVGLYIIYKLYIENKIKEQVIENVGAIKSNIEKSSQNLVTDGIKTKLNSLMAILLIGLFSDFNYIMVACFVIVFIFTMKDIYSNINK